MNSSDFLSLAADDARSLLRAAETAWERPVRQCPGWNAADLVGHIGQVLEWIGSIAESRARVSRSSQHAVPESNLELPSWYRINLERTLDSLGAAAPESESWTLSRIGDHRIGWWNRRLAVEVAIHRWDLEDAAACEGAPPPHRLNSDVATAGVEEFMVEFLPKLVSQQEDEGLRGAILLDSTDGSRSWLHLDDRASVSSDSMGVTTIRASSSDILLWLTNRIPWKTLEVTGPTKVLEHWVQLRR